MVGDPTIAASYVVQPLSVTDVDFAADTVTGTAAPGSTPRVTFDPFFDSSRRPTADAAGVWTADFSVPDPSSGDPAYDLTEADNIIAIANPDSGPPRQTVVDGWTPLDDCMQLPDPAATTGPDLTFTAPVAVQEVGPVRSRTRSLVAAVAHRIPTQGGGPAQIVVPEGSPRCISARMSSSEMGFLR